MRILILNTDSVLNPGDAGISLAQIAVLKRAFPGTAVSLTSRTPGLDRRLYGPLGVTVLAPFLPAPSLWSGVAAKLLGSALGLAAPAPKLRLVRAVWASDLVISSGGGLLYSNRRGAPGMTFYQNVFHVRLALALGKPVVFFPQSFGPFASAAARRAVFRILAHPGTKKIFVRENISMEMLRRAAPPAVRDRMELCPDMAFLLEPEAAVEADPSLDVLPRPRLALTVRSWDFPDAGTRARRRDLAERYLRSVQAAARRFCLGRRGSVMVVPHVRGPGVFEDDRVISRRLWALIKEDFLAERRRFVDLPDDAPPSRLMSVYAKSDIVLATRTHSAVFAILTGRPVVSVHYQPKGPGILAMLGQERRSLPIAGLSESLLADALESAFIRSAEEAEKVRERVSALRAEVEEKLGRALQALV